TLEAGADLSAVQFHFVVIDSDAQISAAGNGAAAVGVLQNKPAAAGRGASVAVGGVTRVECGGTIAAGADIGSDANGNAVAATTGDTILGVATEGGASGEIIAMIFQPRGTAA
ncbi:MAG: hypothetical protein AAF545_15330, partial [Pseudomonadota bacterium]